MVPTVFFITLFCVTNNFYLFHFSLSFIDLFRIQLNSPKAIGNSPVSFGPRFGNWDREVLIQVDLIYPKLHFLIFKKIWENVHNIQFTILAI